MGWRVLIECVDEVLEAASEIIEPRNQRFGAFGGRPLEPRREPRQTRSNA
jgi:hypothetical protein